jgi:hypothetical protein
LAAANSSVLRVLMARFKVLFKMSWVKGDVIQVIFHL